MSPGMEAFLAQSGQQASGGIMGIALGGINNKRQLKQQKKLMQLEIAGQKQMTDYNMMKQLQMWKDTNYGAQMEQLKLAGLNPGLIYGMSGGGGVTTGQASGNVTGGHAPTGGGEAVAMAQTAATLGLMRAQRENIEADTKNKEAQTTKTSGVDTELGKTQIASLTQGINNAKAQQALTEIQTKLSEIDYSFQNETLLNRVSKVNLELSGLIENVKILENERIISDKTVNDKIMIIKREAIGKLLENYLTTAKTNLTNQQINESVQTIKNMLWDNYIKGAELNEHRFKNTLEQNRNISEDMKEEIPDILNIIMGILIGKGLGTKQTPISGFHNRK